MGRLVSIGTSRRKPGSARRASNSGSGRSAALTLSRLNGTGLRMSRSVMPPRKRAFSNMLFSNVPCLMAVALATGPSERDRAWIDVSGLMKSAALFRAEGKVELVRQVRKHLAFVVRAREPVGQVHRIEDDLDRRRASQQSLDGGDTNLRRANRRQKQWMSGGSAPTLSGVTSCASETTASVARVVLPRLSAVVSAKATACAPVCAVRRSRLAGALYWLTMVCQAAAVATARRGTTSSGRSTGVVLPSPSSSSISNENGLPLTIGQKAALPGAMGSSIGVDLVVMWTRLKGISRPGLVAVRRRQRRRRPPSRRPAVASPGTEPCRSPRTTIYPRSWRRSGVSAAITGKRSSVDLRQRPCALDRADKRRRLLADDQAGLERVAERLR